MAYSYLTTCDSCGATSPVCSTKADALKTAELGGWLYIRHLGQHFCKPCRPAAEAAQVKPEPRRTKKQLMREIWAGNVAKMQIALSLRRSGKTLKDCGQLLGVSGSRAGQIIDKAQRYEARGWRRDDLE